MRYIILTLTLLFSFSSISQNNTDNRLELAKELIENDTKSANVFMKDISAWSANFYKYIQSEYLRNKYKKELNNEIRNKLQQLHNSKMNNVKEVEELFGKDALNVIENFYINWYNNQLKSIEIFNEFALIFDYCEFQYNPNSKSEMFVFYSDKCLENYNIKIKEMYKVVNDDESLRSKFKSEFVQAVNLGNKIEPEINPELLPPPKPISIEPLSDFTLLEYDNSNINPTSAYLSWHNLSPQGFTQGMYAVEVDIYKPSHINNFNKNRGFNNYKLITSKDKTLKNAYENDQGTEVKIEYWAADDMIIVQAYFQINKKTSYSIFGWVSDEGDANKLSRNYDKSFETLLSYVQHIYENFGFLSMHRYYLTGIDN